MAKKSVVKIVKLSLEAEFDVSEDDNPLQDVIEYIRSALEQLRCAGTVIKADLNIPEITIDINNY